MGMCGYINILKQLISCLTYYAHEHLEPATWIFKSPLMTSWLFYVVSVSRRVVNSWMNGTEISIDCLSWDVDPFCTQIRVMEDHKPGSFMTWWQKAQVLVWLVNDIKPRWSQSVQTNVSSRLVPCLDGNQDIQVVAVDGSSFKYLTKALMLRVTMNNKG